MTSEAQKLLLSIPSLLNGLVAIVIALGLIWSLSAAVLGRIDLARARAADAILFALSIVTGITLLRATLVRTWNEIGMLVAIFGLRFLIKEVFKYERAHL